jgi:hypothetical protein
LEERERGNRGGVSGAKEKRAGGFGQMAISFLPLDSEQRGVVEATG